eukprot:6413636-Prymnesium_polylepis.1
MLSPLKWLDAHLQCKEGCADKQCHQDARLIGFLSDQQHEADDCGQGWGRIVDLVSSGLAEAKQGVCGWGSAIIQRSWDRDGAGTVSAEKCDCAAQRRLVACFESVAACPQQRDVQQGNADGYNKHEKDCRVSQPVIASIVATNREVAMEVAPEC